MYRFTNIRSFVYYLNEAKITPYVRTNPRQVAAMPMMTIFECSREDKQAKDLEKKLFDLTNIEVTNHVLFKVEFPKEHFKKEWSEIILALWFEDERLEVGIGVEVFK